MFKVAMYRTTPHLAGTDLVKRGLNYLAQGESKEMLSAVRRCRRKGMRVKECRLDS